jgi:hypothetical protein
MSDLSTMKIEVIEDINLRSDLETVCKNVLSIYEMRIAKVPPLGIGSWNMLQNYV